MDEHVTSGDSELDGGAAVDPDLGELETLERRLRDLEQELENAELGEQGSR